MLERANVEILKSLGWHVKFPDSDTQSLEKGHWEIKGRFRKRVVLANVPSFRFSFRGNIRRNHPFGNHPFVNTKKGHWEIKGRFPKGWFWRTYPRSGFRSGGTSAETTLLETALLRTPEKRGTRKISHQISRHLRQREKQTPHFRRVAALTERSWPFF